MDKIEPEIASIVHKFCDLECLDDKIKLVNHFLSTADKELKLTKNLGECKGLFEKYFMTRIFKNAFAPHGDVERDKDEVFTRHIAQLQDVTPDHSALQIPKIYHQPWDMAQKELSKINAYKSPQAKLECVINTSKVIMSLLHLTGKKKASADDFFPILIFVVLKLNPPRLLSNVQYIQSFCSDQLEQSESGYWFTQFSSAVTFIKMLYPDDFQKHTQRASMINVGVERLRQGISDVSKSPDFDPRLDDPSYEKLFRAPSDSIASVHFATSLENTEKIIKTKPF